MHLTNAKTQLAVAVLTAVATAAPTVLPLDTLSPSVARWVAGVLALVMVALATYKVMTEAQGHEHEGPVDVA